MTDLRTAAQQALEALMKSHTCPLLPDDCENAITALRAVLAEDALNRLAENERALGIQMEVPRTALAQEQAEPVLQTCNCRWDGDVQVQQCTLHEAHVDAIHEWAERAKTAEKKLAALAQAEPVQEPVAYRHLHEDGWEYSDAPTGEDCAECQALYTAPPKLVPLTEEEIDRIDQSIPRHTELQPAKRLFARAVERAHGIGGQDGR